MEAALRGVRSAKHRQPQETATGQLIEGPDAGGKQLPQAHLQAAEQEDCCQQGSGEVSFHPAQRGV